MKLSSPQKQLITESTAFLKYLTRKLPNTPKYVIKDWIYQLLKPAGRGEEDHWDWSDLNDVFKHGGYAAADDFGPLDKIVWTPKPKPVIFNIDMFNAYAKKHLNDRVNKSPKYWITKDAKRHSIQASRLGPKELAFEEPAIMFLFPNGEYELIEGWHRTIQAFQKYGDNFKAMSYIGQKN
jgi:hypothetical protein